MAKRNFEATVREFQSLCEQTLKDIRPWMDDPTTDEEAARTAVIAVLKGKDALVRASGFSGAYDDICDATANVVAVLANVVASRREVFHRWLDEHRGVREVRDFLKIVDAV